MAAQRIPQHSRFVVCLRLLNGVIVGIDCDYLNEAISFAERFSEGDWWEVMDNRTGNTMATSDNKRPKL